MSHIESPIKTVERFIASDSWQKDASVATLFRGLVSVAKETKREPDFDYFESINGTLYDPITNEPVLQSIKNDTPLYEVEYQVAAQLQDWVAKNESGIAVWISPRNHEYPDEKISIFRIAYTIDGRKVVRNSYINFSADLKNKEDLRRFLFTEPDTEKSIPEILVWVQKVSNQPVNTDTSNHEEVEKQAHYYLNQIKSGVSANIIAREMEQRNFLGEYSISCPTGQQSFSELIKVRSSAISVEKTWAYHLGACVNCNSTNVLVGPCNICKNCELVL